MKFLLDTHLLLWWLNDDDRLPESARQLISNTDNDIYISHVSLWEMQIKIMTGKLNANLANILQQLPENGFQQLPTHADHILVLATLPSHHHDPFDRMLIAQAISEPLHLMTHDKQVALYGDAILFV